MATEIKDVRSKPLYVYDINGRIQGLYGWEVGIETTDQKFVRLGIFTLNLLEKLGFVNSCYKKVCRFQQQLVLEQNANNK